MSSILPGFVKAGAYAQIFGKGKAIRLLGGTSGTIDLVSPAAPTPYTWTLPDALPAGDKVIQVSSAGVLTLVDLPAATTPAGSGTEIQYRNNSAFGAVAETSYVGGTLLFTSGAAGTIPLAIKAHASQSGNLSEWRLSTDAVRAFITPAGNFSNTGGQEYSEVFGNLATATGTYATVLGWTATATTHGTAIGRQATASNSSVAVGGSAEAGPSDRAVAIGYASSATDNAEAIGYGANASAGRCTAIGSNSAAPQYAFVCGGDSAAYARTNVYFGKGVSSATPVAWTLNGTGGSGTNIVGGNLVIAPGPSTGNATPSQGVLQGTVPASSGSTAQALIDHLTWGNRLVTFADAVDIVVNATTGTKIGTATSQKLSLWNAAPIVQPTTAIAEAAFAENAGGTAVNVDSTFGGYTLQQIVQALQNFGLLA